MTPSMKFVYFWDAMKQPNSLLLKIKRIKSISTNSNFILFLEKSTCYIIKLEICIFSLSSFWTSLLSSKSIENLLISSLFFYIPSISIFRLYPDDEGINQFITILRVKINFTDFTNLNYHRIQVLI